ncbi:MAG: hypothetical protein LBG19_07715 [Prevotellaceae bacterium]|jgi:hypothetical protein|nr:hypothetical protein [Prevotellaceae bacterium]
MKKIETLEDLMAEKKQLNVVAKQMEDGLQEDFQYFSNRIQPFLSIFDGSGSSGKMSSLLLKVATAVVPLLLSRRKAKTGIASASSPWMALGTTALGLLADGQANGLIEKISSFFGKKKKKRKHRKHRLCRCK